MIAFAKQMVEPETWLFLGGPYDGELYKVLPGTPRLEVLERQPFSVRFEDEPRRIEPIPVVTYVPEGWRDSDGNEIVFARVIGDKKPALEYLVSSYVASAKLVKKVTSGR